ncbi:hypothetical protein J6590_021352 [Homalodisca vitripennis]|nr:hypothetical protein J6590_021352 [Homalodisca vitripennis]
MNDISKCPEKHKHMKQNGTDFSKTHISTTAARMRMTRSPNSTCSPALYSTPISVNGKSLISCSPPCSWCSPGIRIGPYSWSLLTISAWVASACYSQMIPKEQEGESRRLHFNKLALSYEEAGKGWVRGNPSYVE